AGLLYIYLHYYDLAREILPKEAAAERARCFLLEKRWNEAAAEYLAADQPVQTAVAYEEAKDVVRARDTWAQLVAEPRLRDRPYERALVHFDLGMAIQRAAAASEPASAKRSGPPAPAPTYDRADVTRHLVAAQRLLEQVADDYETAGERE